MTRGLPDIRTGSRGFTLLELVVALTVAAILVAVAIPSYQSLIERNTLAATVNDLVGDLNYARSEAVTRGRNVYLCSSRDQNSCTSDGNWSDGWILFVTSDRDPADPSESIDQYLRVHNGADSAVAIETEDNGPLRFNSNGFAMVGRTFKASANDQPESRDIVVSATGRVEARDPS
ncbi:GspH/FimT family pseudopilin [Salinisphaera orenii]|uniref:Type II secretion system protein H n=1 Tax=Salinisphaera orenii YIM 95161 TaxID=1051139 RepID=A0A423PIU7_9GAMM|nr:GspH/FimT family pseudopilin [Salinisphaera halophila]ROO25509.1 general secretion pathway protein H [Salinisphaera halophila YIM 95161]